MITNQERVRAGYARAAELMERAVGDCQERRSEAMEEMKRRENDTLDFAGFCRHWLPDL
jgi:hypothetical protein